MTRLSVREPRRSVPGSKAPVRASTCRLEDSCELSSFVEILRNLDVSYVRVPRSYVTGVLCMSSWHSGHGLVKKLGARNLLLSYAGVGL